jgi:hypothetical protein
MTKQESIEISTLSKKETIIDEVKSELEKDNQLFFNENYIQAINLFTKRIY